MLRWKLLRRVFSLAVEWLHGWMLLFIIYAEVCLVDLLNTDIQIFSSLSATASVLRVYCYSQSRVSNRYLLTGFQSDHHVVLCWPVELMYAWTGFNEAGHCGS